MATPLRHAVAAPTPSPAPDTLPPAAASGADVNGGADPAVGAAPRGESAAAWQAALARVVPAVVVLK